jgi:hypothetical protein
LIAGVIKKPHPKCSFVVSGKRWGGGRKAISHRIIDSRLSCLRATAWHPGHDKGDTKSEGLRRLLKLPTKWVTKNMLEAKQGNDESVKAGKHPVLNLARDVFPISYPRFPKP